MLSMFGKGWTFRYAFHKLWQVWQFMTRAVVPGAVPYRTRIWTVSGARAFHFRVHSQAR